MTNGNWHSPLRQLDTLLAPFYDPMTVQPGPTHAKGLWDVSELDCDLRRRAHKFRLISPEGS